MFKQIKKKKSKTMPRVKFVADYNKQHGHSKRGTVTWFTPKWIIDAIGPINLDPCSHIKRPFKLADKHYTIEDNGLTSPWHGMVFCNPPYDDIATWLERCYEYENAIALVFNKTETHWFFEWIWKRAYAVTFIAPGRVKFLKIGGQPGKSGSGAGSILVAYNKRSAERIKNVPGFYIESKNFKLCNLF